MKVLIVEDEPTAAKQLQYLLNQLQEGHEIVGIVETVVEGRQWFLQNPAPDLIFSDIQLADGLAFDIYAHTQPSAPIIFTTAFDEYAIKAFKLNSIDYLLKPIGEEALRFALEKYQNQQLATHLRVQELIRQQAFVAKNYRKSFLIKYRDRLLPFDTQAFAYFLIDNGMVYGQLHDGRKYLIDHKLDDLEQQLDPREFVRANRQYILSHRCIVGVNLHFNSRLNLHVSPAAPSDIIISKEKVTAFKKWFEQR